MTVTRLDIPSLISPEGIQIEDVTIDDVRRLVAERLETNTGGWIVTVNVDILRQAHRDASFAGLVGTATLRVADGMPLLWLAKCSGQRLRERITGADLIWGLAEVAEAQDRSVAFIGSWEDISSAAARTLQAKLRKLDVSLRVCPAWGFEKDEEYVDSLCRQLVQAAPGVVFVALGSPKQDLLITRLRERVAGTWFVGVGGALDFVSGVKRRAPKRVQQLGLEWFFRFVHEPGRLGRRYFVDDLPFTIGMLAKAQGRRLGHRLSPVGRK